MDPDFVKKILKGIFKTVTDSTKLHGTKFWKHTKQDSFTFESLCLTTRKKDEILSITVDNKLNLNNHIRKIKLLWELALSLE